LPSEFRVLVLVVGGPEPGQLHVLDAGVRMGEQVGLAGRRRELARRDEAVGEQPLQSACRAAAHSDILPAGTDGSNFDRP
jgi:hypothetical protein